MVVNVVAVVVLLVISVVALVIILVEGAFVLEGRWFVTSGFSIVVTVPLVVCREDLEEDDLHKKIVNKTYLSSILRKSSVLTSYTF